MRTEQIALMPRQVVSLGLLVALPFLASAVGIAALSGERGNASPDLNLVIALSLLCVLVAGGLMLAIVARRSIVLAPDKLTVKHSFYTLDIVRSDASGAQVKRLHERREIGISTKRNGVAAFGFYSGWFFADGGKPCFCAVSALPVYAVYLPNNAECAVLAISCTEEMAEALREWARN